METRKKSLRLNAILNAIKQVCSILFPMITFPFASRILGKASYGKINFSQSIISYILLIASLGISNYAIREGAKIREDKRSLNQFANEVFTINLCSMLVSYLILFILILFWKRLDGYGTLLLIQGLSIFFTTIGIDWVNSLYEDFTYITLRYILCQSVAVVLMLLLVRSSDDYLIYALTSVSSTVLANIMNVGYIRRTYGLRIVPTYHPNFKKHIKPIMILFGTSIASLIYINSDVTILGILKNDSEVGLYSVSAKIYTLVKNLMNSMLIVAIPRISNEIEKDDRNQINSHLSDILSNLILLIIPACIGLFMLSHNIISLLSGVEYLEATSSLQILSISLIFASLACFFINVVMIPYRMESNVLFATIISAIINIIFNIILIPKWGQDAAALTTLASEIIMTVLGIYYTRHVCVFKLSKPILVDIINGLAVFTVCKTMIHFVSNDFFAIVLSVLLSLILCFLILLIFYKDKIHNLFFKGIRKNKL